MVTRVPKVRYWLVSFLYWKPKVPKAPPIPTASQGQKTPLTMVSGNNFIVLTIYYSRKGAILKQLLRQMFTEQPAAGKYKSEELTLSPI